MVMVDKRELILARTFEVGKAVTGFKINKRNEGGWKNKDLPAFVLLDGDERVDLQQPTASRAESAPVRVVMNPELYILLDKAALPRDTDLGQRLNEFRMKLTKALATDQELLSLLGSNGSIAYNGCVTDLKSGQSLDGQMRIDYQIKYFFSPT